MEFLKSNLQPCVQYYLWGDAHTGENTRMMYAKRTPFPFNFWYPQKYIKKCDQLMQLCEHFSIDDKIENHQTENVSYIKNVRYLFLELLHNLYHKTNDWGP